MEGEISKRKVGVYNELFSVTWVSWCRMVLFCALALKREIDKISLLLQKGF